MCNEIICQCEVLRELANDNIQIEFLIVENFAPLFRHVIEEFKISHRRPPTKDELIWVCSEHLDKNIRELVEHLDPHLPHIKEK